MCSIALQATVENVLNVLVLTVIAALQGLLILCSFELGIQPGEQALQLGIQ